MRTEPGVRSQMSDVRRKKGRKGPGHGEMFEMVLGLPGQMAEAGLTARKAALGPRRRFDRVFVAGMGGSGISADIARGLLEQETAVPVAPCRDYTIPAAVTGDSLFIAVSYSGNTEETLAAFEQAAGRGCRMVAITGGGKLAEFAGRRGVPVVSIPPGLPPRAALGYLFASLLVTLERLGVCHSYRKDIEETVGLLERRKQAWRRRARSLAGIIRDRLPIVYSTSRLLDAVAERWRCQLNENAKVMCHVNAFPEHNHNEIVGMGAPEFLPKRSVVVALVDSGTHPRTRLRLGHVLDITRGTYARAVTLESNGESALARVFSLLMLGDLVSVELAALRGVDPMPVTRIDELKRRMARTKIQGAGE